jgi:virginiamycin B lyase
MSRRLLATLPMLSAVLMVGSSLAVPLGAQRGGRGAATPLPEGDGKPIADELCSSCHPTSMIASSNGYTRDGWIQLFTSMVDVPPAQSAVLADYLAKNFPEKPAPEAVLIQGPAKVDIKEWMLPTRGSRPHDPLATPDGMIWWTGMFANKLGRLNPKTGEMKEYPLTTPRSGPHGLTNDKDGNIWFTANSSTYVGKLDPKSGKITEYPLNLQGARGPHTPIFDQKGTLWFTLQSGMVGRIIPSTGEMKIVRTPSNNTYPYGIKVDSHGTPWYVDFRGNRIGSINPQTMEITEHTLPNPDARPRRLAIDANDVIWYSDYARGYLGRFDTKTGAVKEWPSPGGPESQPYGIAELHGIIWYSESGVRPNTLVRFDPKTEKFQTWVIPSGGGVVRNMMTTVDGNLALACSGVNRVALVTIQGN